MKRLVAIGIWIGCLLSLSACSSYYYSVLNSADRIDQRNSSRDFVQENDTVGVMYCFFGENAPVQITVHNKLDEPLYVDWTRSGIIIDDVATSYDPGTLTIEGNVAMSSSGSGQQWSDGSVSSSSSSYGRFSGEAVLPRGVTFIPPQSRVTHTPMDLGYFSFDAIPNSEYRQFVLKKEEGAEVKARSINFTEQNSPLRFRSFLTLYTDGHADVSRKKLYLERSFYLSRLIKTGNVPPSSFAEGQREDGDFFYIHKVKGVTTGVILGSIAIGVAGIAVEAAVGSTVY